MAKENDKYFVPDISDIRVGYECEVNAGLLPGFREGWSKETLTKENHAYYMKFGNVMYRVPYLTKEQIEAEGWEWRDNKPFDRSFFVKGNYFLVLFKDYTAEIVMADVLKNEYLAHTSNGRMFAGKIKDINTFRYICKLLGIS